MSQTLNEIFKIDPAANLESSGHLSKIWDEVVDSIIMEMMALTGNEIDELHIHLKAEMVHELAKLIAGVSERVVNIRVKDRKIVDIDADVERIECFNELGREKISETAKNLTIVWLSRYNERWKLKSRAFHEKDKIKKATKVVPKKVEENHFIPKSIIKRYWSEGQHIHRNTKISLGRDTKKKIPVGSWGYKNNLYSDYLEAYFSLLEGDAVEPIRKMLSMEPLNDPERKALVGFIVIQRLRNPYFMKQLRSQMIPVVTKEVGVEKAKDDLYMRSVYESMYRENEFYSMMAKPILSARWAVVSSDKPAFILPDVFNIFGEYEGERYVIMPLTPKMCFLSLPIAEEIPRVVPHQITLLESMTNDFSNVLRGASQMEYLSDSTFEHDTDCDEYEVLLKRIIENLITATNAS